MDTPETAVPEPPTEKSADLLNAIRRMDHITDALKSLHEDICTGTDRPIPDENKKDTVHAPLAEMLVSGPKMIIDNVNLQLDMIREIRQCLI